MWAHLEAGEYFRVQRRRRGLSINQVVELTEICRTNLIQFENGQRALSSKECELLYSSFGADVDYIFDERDG